MDDEQDLFSGEKRASGFPSPAERTDAEALDLNALLVRRRAATFFVRMSGDAMAGAGIRSGDILVVDRSLSPSDGTPVVAFADGEFVVRFWRRTGDRVSLEAADPRTPPVVGSAEREIRLFGVVTACVHRFAKGPEK